MENVHIQEIARKLRGLLSGDGEKRRIFFIQPTKHTVFSFHRIALQVEKCISICYGRAQRAL